VKFVLLKVTSENSEDPTARVQRITQQVSKIHGAEIILLPELWISGAFATQNLYLQASEISEHTVEEFMEIARLNNCWIIPGSFAIKSHPGKLRNVCYVIDSDGKIVSSYTKNHLFGFGSGESEFFEAGDEFENVKSPWGKLGVAICYDLRFPELFRAMVVNGAEILIVISSWPKSRIDHWKTLIKARAIENQCFVIGVNSYGFQSGSEMAGSSMVIAPDGHSVLPSSENNEFLFFDIELESLRNLRQEFPVLTSIKKDYLQDFN
jgi:predicted amidohydrolase